MGELVAGEVAVAVFCDRRFVIRHSVEVTQEICALNVRRLNAIFTQFPKEATIAVIDSIRNATKVANVVIGGTSVDMVDGHTLRDCSAGSHINSMCSEDVFFVTKSMFEQ